MFPPMRYEEDFYLWTREQAAALRQAARVGANVPVDWENVAEEIESLGRSDRRELSARIATIMEHLLKLQSSTASNPRAGWRATILRERGKIEELLEDSPSLRRQVTDIIARQLPLARRAVERELEAYGEALADVPDYSEDQVLGEWLP